MAKYDFDDGSTGTRTESIKLEPPCMIRAEVDSVFSSKSKYGQSLGVSLKGVHLVDGIFGQDTNSGNYKVLSWGAETSIPRMTEDTTVDDLGDYVVRNYVGNQYEYEVLEARLEEDEEVGYPTTPEEEIELGDFVFFTGATDNGPKSASKTLSKILAAQGRDVVVDENSKDEWLDEDVALREDLVGREIILAMTKKEADDTGRTFHHPYVLDGKTRAPIFVDNNADSGEEDEEEEEVEEEADEGPDLPEDLESFYSTCRELNINQQDAVEGLLDDMVGDGDVSEESVEDYGRDQIIEDLTA